MDTVTKRAKTLYNEILFGNFSYEQKRARYDTLLHKFLRSVGKGTLYDIGCGAGSYLATYLKFGISKKQITALDLAPQNIEQIQTSGFHAVCADIQNLPFKDSVAEFTIANGVIHHASNPNKAFAELVRITKPEGLIYINVYNRHAYFYIIHKATWPIRYIYWNWNKKIFTIIYPISKILFQPLVYMFLGEFLDDKTGKQLFMDQVLTPRAYLFSKSKLLSYAKQYKCSIQEIAYNRYYLMIAAIILKNP